MIILGPSALINQAELVQKLHMMELPLTIKSTCYGAVIHGTEDVVMKAIEQIRELDPCNIFTKDRGFPPGDPRRCRAKRGAAREGFHQLEKEFELLEGVSEALEMPREVHVEKACPLDPDTLKKLINECEE
jgi:putative methanogenesis marker protein 6